jgi:hypothetical protein
VFPMRWYNEGTLTTDQLVRGDQVRLNPTPRFYQNLLCTRCGVESGSLPTTATPFGIHKVPLVQSCFLGKRGIFPLQPRGKFSGEIFKGGCFYSKDTGGRFHIFQLGLKNQMEPSVMSFFCDG